MSIRSTGERCGVVHSIQGRTLVATCAAHRRCKAWVDLDGSRRGLSHAEVEALLVKWLAGARFLPADEHAANAERIHVQMRAILAASE